MWVIVGQSGLGLPHWIITYRDDPALAKRLGRPIDKLPQHDPPPLLGEKDADKRAAAVYALEMDIAKAHWPAEERRDADKTYNPMLW